jgi:methionyl-tRNA formyltransferase
MHYSLLPALRGPSPIQWALLEGREETGATLMKIDEEMDHGPIISQEEVPILPDDTFETLVPKLNETGVKMLLRDVPKYVAGELSPLEQDHNKATYCKMILKEDGHVRWDESVEALYNMWRAFHVWPGIYTIVDGVRLKLKTVSPALTAGRERERGVLFTENEKLYGKAGNGSLEIHTIQPEGRKEIDGRTFVNGYARLLDRRAT